ncbi:hypothetical protein [Chitinimonas sp.]|uniref:hypothetical protein n=1 Tax=Chitinimonas sp. TaxID=1934313 RepID=UPI0035B002DC
MKRPDFVSLSNLQQQRRTETPKFLRRIHLAAASGLARREPAWVPVFLAHYQLPEKPTVNAAYREFIKAPHGDTTPSIYQVRRFLAQLGTKDIKPMVRRDFTELLDQGGNAIFSKAALQASRERREIAAKQRLGCRIEESVGNEPYHSPDFANDAEAELLALKLLRGFHGMPVTLIRQVLRRADFWLDATTQLNTAASEFQRAYEGYRRASEQSTATPPA